jgi:two-component system, LytTR family, sensor kinase
MLTKSDRNNLLYHSLFWLAIYLIWIFIFRNYSFSFTKNLTVEFCYLIFITLDYYAATYFIIPQFLKKRRYAWFVLIMILLVAMSALARALISREMNRYVFTNSPSIDFGTLYFNSVVNIFIWVELIVVGKMIFDRIYDQQQLAILEKERAKHELDFLKAQINPHALFNSLNSIYGHIDKSNHAARNILLQFSGLLRYQLYDCMVDEISLEKEIEYIRNYIAFQQIRKDENLVVDMDTDIAAGAHKIAPLLLVILTENAFKFVSSFSDKVNRIAINIVVSDNLFTFHIRNTTELLPGEIAASPGGIGLDNLKRRLELLYPGKYELSFDRQDNCFEATLKLKWNEN